MLKFVILLELTQQLYAIDSWHDHIDENQIEGDGFEQPQGLLGIGSRPSPDNLAVLIAARAGHNWSDCHRSLRSCRPEPAALEHLERVLPACDSRSARG